MSLASPRPRRLVLVLVLGPWPRQKYIFTKLAPVLLSIKRVRDLRQLGLHWAHFRLLKHIFWFIGQLRLEQSCYHFLCLAIMAGADRRLTISSRTVPALGQCNRCGHIGPRACS